MESLHNAELAMAERLPAWIFLLYQQINAADLHVLACRTTGKTTQSNTPQMFVPLLRRFDRQISWG
jgi:hypothetical protein